MNDRETETNRTTWRKVETNNGFFRKENDIPKPLTKLRTGSNRNEQNPEVRREDTMKDTNKTSGSLEGKKKPAKVNYKWLKQTRESMKLK